VVRHEAGIEDASSRQVDEMWFSREARNNVKVRYDTMRYDIFTYAQKLTKWPA